MSCTTTYHVQQSVGNLLDEVFEDIESENMQSPKLEVPPAEEGGLLNDISTTVTEHARNISTTLSSMMPSLFSKSSSEDSTKPEPKKARSPRSPLTVDGPPQTFTLQSSTTPGIETTSNLAFISMSLPAPSSPLGPLKLQSIPSDHEPSDDELTVFSNATSDYDTMTMIEHKSPKLGPQGHLGDGQGHRPQLSSSTNGSLGQNVPPMSPIYAAHNVHYASSVGTPGAMGGDMAAPLSPTNHHHFGGFHGHYGMPQMNQMSPRSSTAVHASLSPRESFGRNPGPHALTALSRSQSHSRIPVGPSSLLTPQRSAPNPMPTANSVQTLSLDSFYPIPVSPGYAASYHGYKSSRRTSPNVSGPLPHLPTTEAAAAAAAEGGGRGGRSGSAAAPSSVGSPRGLAMPLPRLQNHHSGPVQSVQVPHIIDADHGGHGMPRLRRAASHESMESTQSMGSTQSRSSVVTSKTLESVHSMHSIRSTQSMQRAFPGPIAVNNSTYLRSIRSQPVLTGLANEGYSTPNSSMGTLGPMGLPVIAEDPVSDGTMCLRFGVTTLDIIFDHVSSLKNTATDCVMLKSGLVH